MSEDAHDIGPSSPQDQVINSIPKRTFESANEFSRFYIQCFCENLAELGCPREEDSDMWFRHLSKEDGLNVIKKLNSIIEKNYP